MSPSRNLILHALVGSAIVAAYTGLAHAASILDLGTLGGSSSLADGYGTVNNAGQIVGTSNTTGNAANHAFRTAATGAITAGSDLGTLGGTNSVAYGINASGQAVGYSYTTGNAAERAFFADVTGPMIDLNTLLPAGSGWVLTRATGINDVGQISGYGTIGGQQHAFLLTIPEPTSFSILALGGIALLRRKRVRL